MPEDPAHRLSSFSSLFHKLHVRSALNPMLFQSALGILCIVIATYAFKGFPFLMYLLVIVGLIPLLTTCGMAVFFTVKSPEKLQSEDFQLRQQSLQIIQKNRGRTEIDAHVIVAITNPEAPKLITEGEPK